ncbi:hypothetical protein ASPCADRAFT_212025 [Aspergillus carbonarius ITEM 5010]|uniref:Uncharacterized protein n=1 Tax=Aspergillus carbonarius (strain ITEM 5010) TaxID=602072 RepID=A0A1R3R7E9_ASPC5|nr:hypothetical protein ASPCADRAFT_212025 [Aspergillus carbonarius ITEM 5010]
MGSDTAFLQRGSRPNTWAIRSPTGLIRGPLSSRSKYTFSWSAPIPTRHENPTA